MKVLKKGRPQKGWAKQFTCTGAGHGAGGCGAVLLVEEADLYSIDFYSYGEYDGSVTSFKCPCCGMENDVKVPEGVNVRRKK